MHRRAFHQASLGAVAASTFASTISFGNVTNRDDYSLHLPPSISDPIRIRSIEALRLGKQYYVRVRSTDGAEGLAGGSRLPDLLLFVQRLVAPYFVNKDARKLEQLVDGVYVHGRNYKYAGMPFWNSVAHVELATLDMLGKIARRPVGALFGKVLRNKVPVYISRFNRQSTAKQEVAAAEHALQQTQASAVKLKVGLRMRNSPAQSKRDRQMVDLARKKLGNEVAIYLDANGSYTAKEAIQFGRFLQKYNVGFLEEPCPWEEYEATKRVADALELTIAGGEQDSSFPRFRWMIHQHAVDLVQPDLYYNGGMIRTLRIARLAESAKLPITPHSPKTGVMAAPMLHFASIVRNLGPHQEYRHSNEVKNGFVSIPNSPGLGFKLDEEQLRKAKTLIKVQ